ncbi:hypothetical protein GR702_17100 [Novosphingobium sp. FGD1]|jgi:hypothetical protein|uniref:Uncharacterized protein n=2 Tax=Novosphingobium silvae TaxID=2692619 RepID=A0A7X4K8P8_9SPHN|nr:hypothetical protein [Novosphingobium silvae]
MFQADLFRDSRPSEPMRLAAPPPTTTVSILERLSTNCKRPRYAFMVLNLLVEASQRTGSAGPYVLVGDMRVPVRDWLCDALVPVAQRDPRRLSIEGRVRQMLEDAGALPADPDDAQRLVDEKVLERIRISGRTNVSRAVSELVRAGLVKRHYQGFRVDHHNRGAKRQAVYVVTEPVMRALSRATT